MSSLNKQMQKGFTLIELLVYIILSSIVVILASQFWYNSAVFSIRSKAKMSTSMDASQLMVYFEEEIGRIGANIDLSAANLALDSFVYIDPDAGDFSSFDYEDNADQDELTYLTSVYDDDGELDHKEEVVLEVINDSLYRTVQIYNLDGDTDGDPVKTLYADNVKEFNIRMGVANRIIPILKPAKTIVLPSDLKADGSAATPTPSGDMVTLTDFVDDTEAKWTLSTLGNIDPFSLIKGRSYSLEFVTVANSELESTFNPITDFLRVQFLDGTGNAVDNVPPFDYYPGKVGDDVVRKYEFNPGKKVDGGKFVFSAKFKKKYGAPSIDIGNISFNEVGQAEYDWDVKPSDTDYVEAKKVAKALEIELVINKKTGIGGNDDNLTRVKKIISMPNNGI